VSEQLKSSLKSGEYWLVVAFVIGCMYLSHKGVSAEDITQYGEVFVAKVRDGANLVMPLISTLGWVGFRVYQKVMFEKVKIDRLKIELESEVEKLKAELSAKSGE